MAPIPRCDLRLPSEPRGIKRVSTVTEKPTVDDEEEESIPKPAHARLQRDSAQIIQDQPEFSTGLTRDAAEVREHHLAEKDEEEESVPEPAHARRQRDSAQIIEDKSEFSTSLTRDQVEIREHHLAERAEEAEDPCAALEQCRAPPEVTTSVEDEEPPETHSEEIDHHATATPGDVCVQFCKERAESPSSDMKQLTQMKKKSRKLRKSTEKFESNVTIMKYKEVECKGTYKSRETFTLFWGSAGAINARKKRELEMKKRRKFLEKLHERNRRRREKERSRAKEKRRMLRCRDQAKIPETKDDITINKAFHLRFNYNKQLPFMPSAMDVHFRKFNKPPFKNYHKGHLTCYKQVDEFEKLRVTEGQTTETAAARTKSKTAEGATRSSRKQPSKAAKKFQ